MAAILDCLDERATRDAWSFQEILRPPGDGGDKDDEILVLHDVGNQKHMLVVSGRQVGTHCVGIAVHNRWSGSVVNVVQGFRAIVLTLRTTATTGEIENLQILSAHFPPIINRDVDEITPAIIAWASLLGGHRRCWSSRRHSPAWSAQRLHLAGDRGAPSRRRISTQ